MYKAINKAQSYRTVLTYSRIWVRQLLGRTVVRLKSKRFLSVERQDLRKWSSMVLGKDLTVTAR